MTANDGCPLPLSSRTTAICTAKVLVGTPGFSRVKATRTTGLLAPAKNRRCFMKSFPALLLFAAIASAQVAHLENDHTFRPTVTNARFEDASVKGDIAQTIALLSSGNREPFWVGYSAAAIPGRRLIC